MPVKDWKCAECEGDGDLLIMDNAGPLCLTCADLDHLIFLAAGLLGQSYRRPGHITAAAFVIGV
jgi:hypothetical protein